MPTNKAKILGQSFSVKPNLEFLSFKGANHHKKSNSKYPEHHHDHTKCEYPKLFWDSHLHGTLVRENK